MDLNPKIDIKSKSEISFVIKPLIILIAIVTTAILVVFFGFKFITDVQLRITENKAVEASLAQKVLALETVNRVLPEGINFLDTVLPSRGAVLYGLSQVKRQAVNHNIIISNLKTGSALADSTGVVKYSIIFETESQEEDLYNFLHSFKKTLPIMNIDKVGFNNVSGLIRGSVTLYVYSADMPTTIPSLSGAVQELTAQEINLLNELATYSLPQFSEPSKSNTPSQRTNPFN